jgi:hypothetical protein
LALRETAGFVGGRPISRHRHFGMREVVERLHGRLARPPMAAVLGGNHA